MAAARPLIEVTPPRLVQRQRKEKTKAAVKQLLKQEQAIGFIII